MMAYLPNNETNEEVAWEAVGEHLGVGEDDQHVACVEELDGV